MSIARTARQNRFRVLFTGSFLFLGIGSCAAFASEDGDGDAGINEVLI
jgi:hypothetical protein